MKWRHHLAAGLAVLLAGGAPALAAQLPPLPVRPEALRAPPLVVPIPDPAALRHTLANGIVVFVDEDHALPLVQVTLAVAAGDRHDPPDAVGLAGFTAALLRRGGAGPWPAADFDARADQLAADLDSLAGTRRSGATLDCSSRVLDQALPLLAAMVRSPRFAADRVGLLRDNLQHGLARREDDPLAVLEREWGYLLLGPDHPSTRELQPAALAALTRERLIAFHRQHWRPSGMVIAVSGDVRAGDVVAALDRLLGDWRDPADPPSPPPPAPLPPPPAPGIYLRSHPTPQAKLALGLRGPQRNGWDDPEEAPLLVLAEVLGGDGTVSRLRRRLRAEQGLVYRARAHIGLGLEQPGSVRLFLESEPRQAGRALALARGELLRLRDEPVPEGELALAKRTLLDLFPLLFDSAEKRAGHFAEDVLLGRPHGYWRGYRERLAGVTAAEVQAAARRHLRPEALVALAVGDRESILSGASAAGVDLVRLFGPSRALAPRDPLTLAPRADPPPKVP